MPVILAPWLQHALFDALLMSCNQAEPLKLLGVTSFVPVSRNFITWACNLKFHAYIITKDQSGHELLNRYEFLELTLALNQSDALNWYARQDLKTTVTTGARS